MKRIKIDSDIGSVVGKGYVVTVNWHDNPEVNVGDVVELAGKAGHFIIRGVETSHGAAGRLPHGALVVQEFEGLVTGTIKSMEDAKMYVLAKRDEGVTCPCCSQYCKVYTRTLNSPMAQFLIWLVKEYVERNKEDLHGGLWISVNDGPLIQNRKGGGDFAKLRYWGLIEQMANDDDTKRTSGYWRPTQAGIDFVHGKTTQPKQVKLYLNECVGFSSEHVTIQEALGAKFDYAELMVT